MKTIKWLFLLFFILLVSDRAVLDTAPVFAQTESALVKSADIGNAASAQPLQAQEDKPLIVPHAGGMIDGESGSNSKDALDLSYADGFRVMELDFNWTSDGNLALIHDWGQITRFCPALSKDTVPSAQQFEATKILGKYDSLTLDSLAAWLKEHADVRIVTDIKEENVKALDLIHTKYPELTGQMIAQIYSYDEYQPVRKLGYENIILTLYAMTYQEKTNTKKIVQFAADHSLFAVTIDKTLFPEMDLNRFVKKDITLYAHTVNDSEEAGQLQETGVFGVYSDSLQPQAMK